MLNIYLYKLLKKNMQQICLKASKSQYCLNCDLTFILKNPLISFSPQQKKKENHIKEKQQQ